MVGWMPNVKSEDRISTEELRTRLKLKSMRKCLQDRRLQWFGHLERLEGNAWSSKCRAFKVSGNLPRVWQGICSKVIRSDLKERKFAKDVAKDKNAGLP